MTDPKKADAGAPIDGHARYITSEEDKVKANKWFSRARELGEKRQFDYAIEYYVNGLEFWPDAVEEACKPLHGCAIARRQTGGKKPGLRDTMKRSQTDKVPLKAFLNSAWLFGHDPDNLAYLEGFLKNASRLRVDDTAMWAAGVYQRALESHAKATAKQFHSLFQALEQIGDRAAARGDAALGVKAFQMGVDVVNTVRNRYGRDDATDNGLRNLSTKLTITRGKYKDGESFRDSIANVEEQQELHDRQRSFQSDERVEHLVGKAREEFQKNPDDLGALNRLVDLLCRQEREDDERQAMTLLMEEFKRTGMYRHKHAADDIRMKQLARRVQATTKSGDETSHRDAQVALLRYELSAFKERMDRYPTDNRVRFEYGLRLFKAGRYDDAIPILQTARSDPRNRTACGLCLGRCFFKKAYYPQAISTLQDELAAYQFSDDETAKSLQYWLGRSQEAAGDARAARLTYGRIVQIDYNYLDVRTRLDQLPDS